MIDLHTHSSCSDGTFSPEKLIQLAKEKGLKYIALTDHDTLAGIKIGLQIATQEKIGFIPGVELEIKTKQGEFHLLGLNLKGELKPLERKLKKILACREQRNLEICNKMMKDGIHASLADFKRFASGEVISRLHIAHFLISQGIVGSVDEAFERFLKIGRPYYCPKAALNFKEAARLIKDCGGKTILAHPFSLKYGISDLQKFILELKQDGLDGVEAYHSDYPLESCQVIDEFAYKHGLLITAGSDFHGDNWPKRKLGFSSNGMPITEKFLEGLL